MLSTGSEQAVGVRRRSSGGSSTAYRRSGKLHIVCEYLPFVFFRLVESHAVPGSGSRCLCGRACLMAMHKGVSCLCCAGMAVRVFARSRGQNGKISDDGSRRKKVKVTHKAVSGQQVPAAAAHFSAPVQGISELLQHTPVPMPVSRRIKDINKVTEQMQKELATRAGDELVQVGHVQVLIPRVGCLCGCGRGLRGG